MTTNGNGCGGRHLKLSMWLIGIIITVMVTAFGFLAKSSGAYDDRLRTVEQQSARIEERLIGIQRTLERIEKGQEP